MCLGHCGLWSSHLGSCYPSRETWTDFLVPGSGLALPGCWQEFGELTNGQKVWLSLCAPFIKEMLEKNNPKIRIHLRWGKIRWGKDRPGRTAGFWRSQQDLRDPASGLLFFTPSHFPYVEPWPLLPPFIGSDMESSSKNRAAFRCCCIGHHDYSCEAPLLFITLLFIS